MPVGKRSHTRLDDHRPARISIFELPLRIFERAHQDGRL